MSLISTPRVNAHKQQLFQKFERFVIEGLKYGRMKCRERRYFINLTKKKPDIKVTLKIGHVREKEDIWSS
jgi:hypothetical protein